MSAINRGHGEETNWNFYWIGSVLLASLAHTCETCFVYSIYRAFVLQCVPVAGPISHSHWYGWMCDVNTEHMVGIHTNWWMWSVRLILNAIVCVFVRVSARALVCEYFIIAMHNEIVWYLIIICFIRCELDARSLLFSNLLMRCLVWKFIEKLSNLMTICCFKLIRSV